MTMAVEWLFPPARRAVMALLLGEPHRRWHQRGIARRTGLALGTVRRELSGLVRAEILTETRDGNRVYCQANPACPILPELAGLMRKTVGLAQVLREALAALRDKIDVAYVYGSQAEGTAGATSDVDLMVIGRASFGDVVAATEPCQERLGREVSPVVYQPAEYAANLASGNHFLTTVHEGPKIPILGTEDELARVAATRVAPASPVQSTGDRRAAGRRRR